ncbi:MAG: pectate lyase [Paludibacter sp.]|nr:pectate lyase [Paludibacter sp.]
MNKRLLIVLVSLICVVCSGFSQAKTKPTTYPAISLDPFGDGTRHWYFIADATNIVNAVPNQPKYTEDEITKIADNMLLFQRNNGGWPKNYDMQAILTPEQVQKLTDTKSQVHTTFDNSTTYTHIEYLAKVYSITHIKKYKIACEKGIEFCLAAQYPNGGWPQYYPIEPKNYSRRITYNDGAFLGVLTLMREIAENDPTFSFVSSSLRKKTKAAYEKGLDCILKTQIVDNGRLTAWCQQHDEITLKPAWARAFEPPSICNGESSAIVLYLMNIDNPNEKIVTSVQSAVKWFNDSKILNTRVQTVKSSTEQSKYRLMTNDKVVLIDSTAKPIWTRYYELGTDKPLFCDRNSKYLYSLAEVSRERRTGYGWYTYSPQEALNKYPAWQKRWAVNENILKK